MSDEQATPSPALRLKPRLRPADGQPAAADSGGSAVIPPPPLPPGSLGTPEPAAPLPDFTSTSKIRLKPRLEANQAATGESQGAPVVPAVGQAATEIPAVIPPPPMANPVVTAPA